MSDEEDLLKLDNQVCFALVTAARNVVSIYRPILEPLGLTHPQYLVMLALWEQSPRSLGELADELAMEPATRWKRCWSRRRLRRSFFLDLGRVSLITGLNLGDA